MQAGGGDIQTDKNKKTTVREKCDAWHDRGALGELMVLLLAPITVLQPVENLPPVPYLTTHRYHVSPKWTKRNYIFIKNVIKN